MMLKSKSTTDIRTQTNSSYRQYGTRKQETRALRATFHNVIDGNIKINTTKPGLFLKKSNFTRK